MLVCKSIFLMNAESTVITKSLKSDIEFLPINLLYNEFQELDFLLNIKNNAVYITFGEIGLIR